jgi:hypothetical protein
MILPLMLFTAVACQPATMELTDGQKAVIAAEVDSIMNEWWAAFTTSIDFDRGMSFTADAPEMAWATNGTLLPSRSAIDAYYRPVFGSIQSQAIEFSDSRTVVLAPDVVCTIRVGNTVVVDTAGNTMPEQTYAETIVWVKRNGEWKVLLGHGSNPSEPIL